MMTRIMKHPVVPVDPAVRKGTAMTNPENALAGFAQALKTNPVFSQK
jgi:hypothetical protein